MRETAADLAALQGLLERSYTRAGPHLLAIHTPERRLDAARIAGRLTGMSLLVLATVTADGRPLVGPVDSVFYRGSFYFSSSERSVRFRHLRARPQVSAAHVPGEHLAVTVHGRATPIDFLDDAHAELRDTLLEVYVPRYGEGWWKGFMALEPVYARIDAARMFAFADPSLGR